MVTKVIRKLCGTEIDPHLKHALVLTLSTALRTTFVKQNDAVVKVCLALSVQNVFDAHARKDAR